MKHIFYGVPSPLIDYKLVFNRRCLAQIEKDYVAADPLRDLLLGFGAEIKKIEGGWEGIFPTTHQKCPEFLMKTIRGNIQQEDRTDLQKEECTGLVEIAHMILEHKVV